ncbi:multiple epidermal growth factor-like domains protein 10 [Haliotis rubra]|uniref:multiple epidermal growth factor-like domains protein 10 n=1 Tax=Haliotis rubra TaxID=36100 RepID=UPI001EE590D2|nr:multiple epidermal growth factor-like domains protein 10 [Haliotis rubra]
MSGSHHYGPNCTKQCVSRHCLGNSSCNSTGACDNGCKTGWTLTDCTACESHLYGSDCTKTCASRHCKGKSSCNSTGGCDNGCETGWTLTDCTVYSLGHPGTECKDECAGNHTCDRRSGNCRSACLEGSTDHGCQESVGDEEKLIPAVTVTAIVVVVAAVVVGVFIRRRRRRQRPSLQESDSHHYYNTSHPSKVQTKTSRNDGASELDTITHDYLNVEVRDSPWCGETRCTHNISKTELDDGVCMEVPERDIYEPAEPRIS